MVKRIIIKDTNIPKIYENVSCIGFFDGLHIGHKKLINETIKQSNKLNVCPTLICFDPDPDEIIHKNKSKHLLSYKDRLAYAEYLGIKQIIIIKFTNDLMKLKPNNFIKDYLNKFNIIKLICGYDFTYGYKGKGNVELLKKNGKFQTIVINEYKYKNKKVSSTRIKEELSNGNIKLVNKLLGYDYTVELKTVDCIKDKKKWIVKAKLKDNCSILPKDGNYSNIFEIKNNIVYIKGNKEIKKGTIIYLSFSNE